MKLGRIKGLPFSVPDKPQATREDIMGMFVEVLEETPEYIRVKSRVTGNISTWMRCGRSKYFVEEDGP